MADPKQEQGDLKTKPETDADDQDQSVIVDDLAESSKEMADDKGKGSTVSESNADDQETGNNNLAEMADDKGKGILLESDENDEDDQEFIENAYRFAEDDNAKETPLDDPIFNLSMARLAGTEPPSKAKGDNVLETDVYITDISTHMDYLTELVKKMQIDSCGEQSETTTTTSDHQKVVRWEEARAKLEGIQGHHQKAEALHQELVLLSRQLEIETGTGPGELWASVFDAAELEETEIELVAEVRTLMVRFRSEAASGAAAGVLIDLQQEILSKQSILLNIFLDKARSFQKINASTRVGSENIA